MLTVRPDAALEPEIAGVLSRVGAFAAAGGVPYFLIGARAIDLLLHNVYGFGAYRPTIDTDFAVAVESWDKFEGFKSELAATGLFRPVSGRMHQLLYKGVVPVDLVPFGGVEAPGGRLPWPPDGEQVMSVVGFGEVSAAAVEVDLGAGRGVVRVAPLPGLFLLKLFAWLDRREAKDARDLAALLQCYEHVVEAEVLYSDQHLLDAFGYDMQLVGAALIGRDLAGIIGPVTKKTVVEMLERAELREKLSLQISLGMRGIDAEKALQAAEMAVSAFRRGGGL